jgi:hypothetical protein
VTRAPVAEVTLKTRNLILLLTLIGAPGGASAAAPPRLELPGTALDHLWRTGRAGKQGLCRAGSRKDPRLRPGSGTAGIGTAHPVFVEAVGSTGGWTHLCQARKDTNGDGKVSMTYKSSMHGSYWAGDDLQSYLVVGDGDGREVEEVLAHDPSGRYLAVREGPCLVVIDTRTATVTTVPDADLRGDRGDLPHRVGFDAGGRWLLYVRGGKEMRLVVRELATGRERDFDPGMGHPDSARLTPDGRWIEVQVGAPRPAHAAGGNPGASCQSRKSGGHLLLEEDKPRTIARRLIPVDEGPSVDANPSTITGFGEELLVRERSGALAVQDRAGQRRAIVPADCKGTLVHADPPRQSVVVVCAPLAPFPDEMILYHPGGHQRLGRQEGAQVDRWLQAPAGQLKIEDRWVDMAGARPMGAPGTAPLEAWTTHGEGIYAHRSDGKRLMARTRSHRRSGEAAPEGPLTWQ